MDKPSDASAFIATLIAFLGVSDFTAANMSEELALQYWLAAVPVRLLFLFAVTGYVYLFKPDGLFGSKSITRASIGEPLQNSLVFAWGFFELAAWFWVCIRAAIGLLACLTKDRSSRACVTSAARWSSVGRRHSRPNEILYERRGMFSKVPGTRERHENTWRHEVAVQERGFSG